MQALPDKITLQSILQAYRSKINRALEDFLSNHITKTSTQPFIEECYRLIKEYVLREGKRLRPACLLLAYESCGGKDIKKVMPIAIALELHHSYSLILDDIMDEDDQRRGKPSVHKALADKFSKMVFGKNQQGTLFVSPPARYAVSFGLMLGNITNIITRKAIQASELDSGTKNHILALLADVDEKLYHGQMMDVYMEVKKKVTEDEYLEMVMLKTGVLIGLSFKLGSILAGAEPKVSQLFMRMGQESAVGFQIQDDLLDVTGKKGHTRGSDILEGKMTLLMLKTLELANTQQKEQIMSAFGKRKTSDQTILSIIDIMKDLGAIEYCKSKARQQCLKAKEILGEINQGTKYAGVFSDLIDYMILREK